VGAVGKDWNGFNILHTGAARVGGLDIGFVPDKNGSATAEIMKNMELTILLGADELKMASVGGFVVYIGTHGDNGAHRADVILPASTYTEKSGIYVNTEGRVQMANRAAFAPGEAKEDWSIIRALSAVLGKPLLFNSLAQLRESLFSEFPHLLELDAVAKGDIGEVLALAKKTGRLNIAELKSPVKDFYLTNPIARASKVMAQCSAQAKGRDTKIRQAAE
ncbi:MAG: molybdopterin-dependent oxidoreductase, partial [Desulfobulbia bacterium]